MITLIIIDVVLSIVIGMIVSGRLDNWYRRESRGWSNKKEKILFALALVVICCWLTIMAVIVVKVIVLIICSVKGTLL